MIEAPDSLWRGIEMALDRDGRPVPGRNRVRIMPFMMQPRFALAALVLVGLVIGFAAFWLRHSPKSLGPLGPSWDVARLDGAPRIGSDLISDKAKLGIGQWLETDSNSRAQISVSDIGQVEIDPNRRVRLVEKKPNEHRAWLAAGPLSGAIFGTP